MLSIDKRIFEEDSDVRARIIGYGKYVNRLDVIVYTKPGFETERIAPNVVVYPTNTRIKAFYFLGAYELAKKILRAQPKDSLITVQDGVNALLGRFLKWRFKVRFQIQIHGDVFNPAFRASGWRYLLEFMAYDLSILSADCVRVVSERARKNLKKMYSKVNATVQPIYVDVSAYSNAKPAFDLKDKYSQFDTLVLVMARLEPEKGVDRAIKVFAETLSTFPRTGLIIVGEGGVRTKLIALSKKLGILSNVIFRGWQDDRVSYYKGADLLLVTSQHEGYGMVIIEALASGCPVLSTDVGVAREAGAEVASAEHLASKLRTFLAGKRPKGELKSYPYTSKDEYEKATIATWENC